MGKLPPFCVDLAGLLVDSWPREPPEPGDTLSISACSAPFGTIHKARHAQVEAAGSVRKSGAQRVQRAGAGGAGRLVKPRL